MITMRERLLANPLRGCEETNRLVHLLKRPAINHADRHMGDVDSFVFDSLAGAQIKALFSDAESIELAIDNFRHPVPKAFFDFGTYGALVEDVGAAISRITLCNTHDGTAFTSVGFEGSIRDGLEPLYDLRGFMGPPFTPEAVTVAESLLVGVLLASCVLQSHKHTIQKRVMPRSSDTLAAKARDRRRLLQRRGVLYSYNKVQLITPDHDQFRGQVITWPDAQSRRRGHWVLGHWRLIANSIVPYWTWVDGHAKGDEALGWVTKERHVNLQGPVVTRRGYAMPFHEGQPGEKVTATYVGG